MPRTTGSSSSSIVAGVPRRTRNDYCARRSRSTARKRKLPAGWPPRTRLLHVSGDAVDIGPSGAAAWLSEHGARVRAVPGLRQRTLALRTAPRSRRCTAVRRCTPTRRTIRGCSSDQHARRRGRRLAPCRRSPRSRPGRSSRSREYARHTATPPRRPLQGAADEPHTHRGSPGRHRRNRQRDRPCRAGRPATRRQRAQAGRLRGAQASRDHVPGPASSQAATGPRSA